MILTEPANIPNPGCVITLCSTLVHPVLQQEPELFSRLLPRHQLGTHYLWLFYLQSGEKPDIGRFVAVFLKSLLASSVWSSPVLFKRSAFHVGLVPQ